MAVIPENIAFFTILLAPGAECRKLSEDVSHSSVPFVDMMFLECMQYSGILSSKETISACSFTVLLSKLVFLFQFY